MRFQYVRLGSFQDSDGVHVPLQDELNKTPLSYAQTVDAQFRIRHLLQTSR